MFWTLAAASALAQDGTTAPSSAMPPQEVNLRYRYLTVPDGLMDTWYFDEDTGAPSKRPHIKGMVLGLEYVLKQQPTNWIFYAEYFGNRTPDGYWDDYDEDGEHNDGDYIAPNGLAMWLVGANFAHEIVLTPETNQVGFSLLVGGGLGVGPLRGGIDRWRNGPSPDNVGVTCVDMVNPAYIRKDTCPPDEQVRLPGVGGVVDVTFSGRLNFNQAANLRLDLGLHDMLYVGGALGGQF